MLYHKMIRLSDGSALKPVAQTAQLGIQLPENSNCGWMKVQWQVAHQKSV